MVGRDEPTVRGGGDHRKGAGGRGGGSGRRGGAGGPPRCGGAPRGARRCRRSRGTRGVGATGHPRCPRGSGARGDVARSPGGRGRAPATGPRSRRTTCCARRGWWCRGGRWGPGPPDGWSGTPTSRRRRPRPGSPPPPGPRRSDGGSVGAPPQPAADRAPVQGAPEAYAMLGRCRPGGPDAARNPRGNARVASLGCRVDRLPQPGIRRRAPAQDRRRVDHGHLAAGTAARGLRGEGIASAGGRPPGPRQAQHRRGGEGRCWAPTAGRATSPSRSCGTPSTGPCRSTATSSGGPRPRGPPWRNASGSASPGPAGAGAVAGDAGVLGDGVLLRVHPPSPARPGAQHEAPGVVPVRGGR